MGDLILDSLEIQQFRIFRHLQIPRLGRVNLITGKNNVGKTCLLEALWLYARRASPAVIWQILEARDEGRHPRNRSEEDAGEQTLAIKHLFYGRKDILESLEPIKIGPISSRDRLLSVSVNWVKDHHALTVNLGDQEEQVRRLGWYGNIRPTAMEEISCVFVPAGGLGVLEGLWDEVVLTDLERDVLSSLRVIAPEVERVNFVGGKDYWREEYWRIPMAKIAGADSPIPLRSLGEGMNRLLGIALALANAKNGMLLIDEVDSGLHYTVQPDLWRLIFQTARRLNVQVFATTHSWDCIEGFQKAAQVSEEDGMLIRLENRQGEIIPILFDEHRLSIATRQDIEVR